MEKQRAFSFKPLIGRLPTRFLVFSFTISFSLLFLTFFPIWVIRVTPSVRQETHFQFNKPSISLGLEEPLTVPTFSSSSRKYSGSEVRNAILIGTHFEIPVDTSEIHKVPEDETNKIDGVNSNLTGLGATSSVTGVNNSILMDTHVKGPEITYGFAKDSVFWGRLRKKGGSEVQDDDIHTVEAITGNSTSTEQHIFHTSFRNVEVSVSVKEKSERVCDVTKGRWVFDESYPLYRNVSCPFIDEGFNCEANGRLDKDYMKWRWQPQDCDIPRFNATKMLDLIRGKRLVFVGDSINRNQWESMLCLLMGAIKDPKRVYESRGRRITKEKGNYCFKFVDYKCTIEYYVTHFLVHESKARVGKKRVQTLRIDTMDRGSSRWKGADILVFNTAHWWTHYKTKSG